jgi:hypothetical protein
MSARSLARLWLMQLLRFLDRPKRTQAALLNQTIGDVILPNAVSVSTHTHRARNLVLSQFIDAMVVRMTRILSESLLAGPLWSASRVGNTRTIPATDAAR